jgi:hypothetical protein
MVASAVAAMAIDDWLLFKRAFLTFAVSAVACIGCWAFWFGLAILCAMWKRRGGGKT